MISWFNSLQNTNWFSTLRRYQTLLHMGAFVLLLTAMIWMFPTTVTGLRPTDSPDRIFTVPHTFTGDSAVYDIEGLLIKDLRTADHLTLRAEGCIEQITIDGAPILAQPCELCRGCVPVKVSLPPTLAPGTHALTIRARSASWLATFDLRQAHGFDLIASGTCLTAGLAWLLVVRRRKMSMWAWWLVVAAMLVAVGYWNATDPMLRQHDMSGHQEYIEYIQVERSLPPLDTGWETFQPPLYYILSVGWIALGTLFKTMDAWRWLQVMAIVAYIAAIVIAVWVWRKFEFPRASGWLGLTLFAFLPTHVLMSSRINNDVLLPVWGTLAACFLWDYARRDRASSLWAASLSVLGACMTKTSSLSLVAGAALFLAWHEWKTRRATRQALIRLACLILPGLVWALIWGGVGFSQTGSWLYSNTQNLPNGQLLKNNAFRYLFFDVRALLTDPFFNTVSGRIRDSWPTSLFVSAILSEHNFAYLRWPWQSFIAASFLPLAAMLAIGICARPAPSVNRPWQLGLALVIGHAVFMLAYNWRYPYAPNQDARLWAPVFFPLALLWSWGYEVCLQKFSGVLYWLCKLSPVVFLALLAGFYSNLFAP